MFRNKYIMMTALCISACMHGAAHNTAIQEPTCSPIDKVSLLDCFKKKTILVPGTGFCAPVVMSQVFVDPPKGRTIRQRLTNKPRGPARKTMKTIIGFVEGADRKLTCQIAQHIMQNFKIAKDMSEIDVKREVNLDDARCAVIKSDVTQFDKVRYTRCGGFLVLQSTNNKSEPVRDKSYYEYCHLGRGGWVKTPDFRPFKSTMLPPSVVAQLKTLSQLYTTDTPIEQKLDDLSKYAAAQTVSHETFFFEFDLQCYSKFLAQELSDNTN